MDDIEPSRRSVLAALAVAVGLTTVERLSTLQQDIRASPLDGTDGYGEERYGVEEYGS